VSVYTRISYQQLEHLLSKYSLGTLISFSGIQSGIQNTNYAVNTTQGRFILTIFESLTKQEIPPFLDLLCYLCLNNFPAPKPQIDQVGRDIVSINEKPAAIFICLVGRSIDKPSIRQCGEIGEYLAKMHVCSKDSTFQVENTKDLSACQAIFDRIRPALNRRENLLLKSELAFQAEYLLPDLPQGIIHADLFRDNVLFYKGCVSGILDFYNACRGYFIYDIAIACSDWCTEEGVVNQKKINAFRAGYEKVRELTKEEDVHFSVFLRRAVMRFWLSRLEHQVNPKKGELTLAKDPVVFQTLLEHYIKQS
jgi:homoserine kinase type II